MPSWWGTGLVVRTESEGSVLLAGAVVAAMTATTTPVLSSAVVHVFPERAAPPSAVVDECGLCGGLVTLVDRDRGFAHFVDEAGAGRCGGVESGWYHVECCPSCPLGCQ